MGFSEPSQILVARSYYEVVSCLSDAYAKLFHYEGSRTDKHVREHEVYAVGDSTLELKLKYEADRPAPPRLTGASTSGKTVIDHLTHFPSRVTENLRTRPRLGTALAVVAILVIAVTLRGMRERPLQPVPPREPVKPIATAPVIPVPEARAPEPAPAAAKPVETAPAGERARRSSISEGEPPSMPAPKTAAAPSPPARPKPKATAPATLEPVPAPPPVAALEPDPLAAGAAGVVSFAIAPWGEIYVDGQKRGVSPPLRDLELSPGQYRIEVRNSTFPTHVQTVEVEAGGRIRIKHQFR
jgi:hypothetical protein